VRAQDAATQERLDKLSGRIEDLTAAQEALKKQISDMSRELESVREQSGKPNTSYARQEDLNLLEKGIKEVDRKRVEDARRFKPTVEPAKGAGGTAAPNQEILCYHP